MDILGEAERLLAEANAAIANFVWVEIESGLTFCRIAKMEKESETRHHTIRQARQAYRSACNGIKKLELTETELDKFNQQLKLLKEELRSAVV